MPIRDIVLSLVVFGSLPVTLARPYVGVLVFTWLSLMQPHRYVWGFALDIPFVGIVGATTLCGLLMSRDWRPVPWVRESLLLGTLWGLFGLTTLYAQNPDPAVTYLVQVSKILLMTFVTIMVMQDRTKLRYLLLVIALSVGFYGFKGGIWGLTTGGENRVWGPVGSYLGDNNALALGLNMTLPLLWYLALEEPRRWLRHTLQATFGLSILAVLLTYSRGGLIGLVAVLVTLWWGVGRRWKVAFVALALVALPGIMAFLPEQWYDRMATIQTYETDTSTIGRFKAWYVGWRIALDSPLLGGGFLAFSREAFAHYVPEYQGVHNAHSIYFHVLGEHGFTGFALYMALLLGLFVSLRGIRRRARRLPGGGWLGQYAGMMESSLIGFAVSGVFQNLTYFDYYFWLVAVVTILKRLSQDLVEQARHADARGPREDRSGTEIQAVGSGTTEWRPAPVRIR